MRMFIKSVYSVMIDPVAIRQLHVVVVIIAVWMNLRKSHYPFCLSEALCFVYIEDEGLAVKNSVWGAYVIISR
jgi:hypothetical protein